MGGHHADLQVRFFHVEATGFKMILTNFIRHDLPFPMGETMILKKPYLNKMIFVMFPPALRNWNLP